ncbi:uncharacterized protein LOC120637385 [Pararge aegeria]|uniref:Jg24203 protein n=1 Tax=Pararge aegeria aegeria TaxID=348720 RepID=A0A8S4RQ24_9NEOP|nr:uncharacterized protein LOC120637385 [Pararge aegeria]CAH2240470.1 jg24203 [Pararge aegeria aegeria]
MDKETADLQDKPITKIEDIIDIQKANGSINVRQVAFRLPSRTDSCVSASLDMSCETRLTNTKLKHKKKAKKVRSHHRKGLPPDVISWPSDSDITVLRMKLHSRTGDKKMGNVILGDGPHQPDSASMINLATLIFKSQPPSKQSLAEEYLLPLTSWEHGIVTETRKPDLVQPTISDPTEATSDVKVYQARCSHKDELSLRDSDVCNTNTRSKVAKFLRLYFCPCCTCLYKLEKMQEEPSACFTKRC